MATRAPETFPRRRFIATLEPPLDEYGFLAPDLAENSACVDEFFALQAVLIVAPPWAGKTFLARQLISHFREHQDSPGDLAPFGKYFFGTLFEQGGMGVEAMPPWWDEWRRSTARACWIVDAVDEDERRGFRQFMAILDAIDELSAEERSRLTLLVLSRENEVPPDAKARLNEIYGDPSGELPRPYIRRLLAPPDADTARAIVGGTEPFERVCSLVAKNRLQGVVCLPAVLDSLKNVDPAKTLETGDVWRRVLVDLLRDRRRDLRSGIETTSMDDRFHAASRMAASLLISGEDEIGNRLGRSSGPSVEDLFPASGPRADQLRKAAWSAIESGAFRPTPTGFAFSQSHIQEWFAAFELENVRLARLLPILADGDGKPYELRRGLMGILRQTTQHSEVRDWIITAHGGVSPRSDAAPWTLDDSVQVLDRLEQIAKDSKMGLAVWHDEGFETLKAPGLGHVLATRLADKSRSAAQRELLIDVARATKVSDIADAAEALICDPTEPPDLQIAAAILLHHVGPDAHLRRLIDVARCIEPTTRDQYSLVCQLVYSFYHRRLLTFVEAAEYVPELGSPGVEPFSSLEYQLLHDMTLTEARILVRHTDWERLLLAKTQQAQQPRRHANRGRQRLLRHAIELIAKQDHPTPDDYELFLPMVFANFERRTYPPIHADLVKLFRGDREARRQLFLAGLDRDPKGQGDAAWKWRSALTAEDTDWLSDVCHERADDSPMLLTWLLRFAYSPDVAQGKRRAIRHQVRQANSAALAEFDASRRRSRKLDKKHQREEEECRRQAKNDEFQLDQLVDDIVNDEKIDLRGKMLNLSRFCFIEEAYRPSNVTGAWEDLGQDRQDTILGLCERALRECEPIPIPDADTYPAGISYQGDAFAKVVEARPSFPLDGAMIEKWLQSLFVFSVSEKADTIMRCVASDRRATEKGILAEVSRRLRLETGSLNLVYNLPDDCWSDELLAGAAKLLEDDSLNLERRGELLRALATQSPHVVEPVSCAWAFARDRKRKSRDHKHAIGLDVLLVADPNVAVPELCKRYRAGGTDVLLRMNAVADPRFGLAANPETWNATSLGAFTDVLYDAFPPATDKTWTSGEAYSSHEDEELRRLRGQLPLLLLRRGTEEAVKVLEHLSAKHDSIREWYRRENARKAASGVLAFLTSPDSLPVSPTGRIPILKAVRLLEDALYRVIRSDADLQRVLLEQISAIEKDVKRHLAMLYGAAPERKHLHEESLQAYLHCRLTDRLPGRVLDRGTEVFLEREPLANKNQRLDLKVQAPKVDSGSATVVIEIKWSDNPTVSTSLSDQLGTDYLVGQGLTHGIYLVGWCRSGTWSRRASGKRPRKGARNDPRAWADAFRSQAEAFSKMHPQVSIAPVVVDLIWKCEDVDPITTYDLETTVRDARR